MHVDFIAGFAAITTDSVASSKLYETTLGLPLEGDAGYRSTDRLDGAKHFGVWPLPLAARSCFDQDEWPADVPVPQATIEFEVADVGSAADELRAAGYELIHGARTEPWGQTVARLLSPEGLLVGLSHTPWLRDQGP